MKFNDVVDSLKTTYSRRILESYGYDNTRKKYTALESGEHNNGDKTPSMGLYNRGGNFYLKDFAGEQKLYSSIDTIMLKEGLSFADAVKHGAELCGIEIDSERQQEELSPDMKYIVSGLYRKAKQEGFSVKAITETHHYLYRDTDGKKLFDKYRVDYSVPPGAERDKRLAELSPEDNSKLYDFDMGLMSGRIRKPENQTKKSEVNTMNKEIEIKSYEDFKKALTKTGTYNALCEFKRNNPNLYEHYQQRLEKEKEAR